MLLPRDAFQPGDQLGPYVIMGELGRGGFGVVLRARESTGREVALKVLLRPVDGTARERFRREGEVMATLDHPGIVRVFGAGEVDGRLYLACELVERAQPLDRAAAALPLEGRAALVRDAARALGHAHARGVVHRDVKAQNLLVGADGRVRVTDFGLALLEDRERLTRSGGLLGTPVTMAPEQLRAGELGPFTDVWALGVVLYQALTGALPFDPSSFPALFMAIDAARPVPPRELVPEVPPALEAVCLRALSRDPAARHADGEDLARALEAALAGEVVAAPRRRGGVVVAAAALVAGVAVLALVAHARSGHEPQPPAAAASGPPVRASAAPARPPSRSAIVAPPLRAGGDPDLATWSIVAHDVERVAVAVEAALPLAIRASHAAETTLERALEPGAATVDVALRVGWNVLLLATPDGRVLERRDVVRLPSDLAPGQEAHDVVARGDGSILRLVPPGRLVRDEEAARVQGIAREVELPRPFFLGAYEVSRAQWQRVVPEAEVRPPDRDEGPDHPARAMTLTEAYAYCDRAGLRLPTLAEWEHAARGQSAQNVRGAPFARSCAVADTSLAGAQARFGHWHLLGNVTEWVQAIVSDQVEPPTVRPCTLGGGFDTPVERSATTPFIMHPLSRDTDTGLRVARDVGVDRGEFYRFRE